MNISFKIIFYLFQIGFYCFKIKFYLFQIGFYCFKINFYLFQIGFYCFKIIIYLFQIEFYCFKIKFYLFQIGFYCFKIKFYLFSGKIVILDKISFFIFHDFTSNSMLKMFRQIPHFFSRKCISKIISRSKYTQIKFSLDQFPSISKSLRSVSIEPVNLHIFLKTIIMYY